ncbi:hypothetical protein PoB_000777700 [Plakobranchus ocellatus]|uniref:Uncharacterized protein n=1 Tax=Plakobranchus ocellatus TaxID=259542 RepID=A0AAV3YEH3_9GAST|nr:hypothetical protein PoB_000777700 [Plakobranchus ocellatus]
MEHQCYLRVPSSSQIVGQVGCNGTLPCSNGMLNNLGYQTTYTKNTPLPTPAQVYVAGQLANSDEVPFTSKMDSLVQLPTCSKTVSCNTQGIDSADLQILIHVPENKHYPPFTFKPPAGVSAEALDLVMECTNVEEGEEIEDSSKKGKYIPAAYCILVSIFHCEEEKCVKTDSTGATMKSKLFHDNCAKILARSQMCTQEQEE